MRFAILLNILLPGTQPGELTHDIRDPSLCQACHGDYEDYAANDTWKGTMMANASRDPIFLAALTIANQDEPDAGDLCLRCHSPRGWLFGRSNPRDGSALEPEDLESVQCDFCHRLTSGPDGEHNIGNAQYFVADDYVRRGPIDDAVAPHEWEHSTYHEGSELCGLCHEVSNPLRDGFAIERTYTEWRSSAYPGEGQTCPSCHLPAQEGFACGARGVPEREVHRHELVGGNAWIPLVLAGEMPELGRDVEYAATSARAVEQLGRAARLTITAPDEATAGDDVELAVRVENLTGHKLPTGYPEGRRMWLEVQATDPSGAVVFQSGAYDDAEARLVEDPQIRAYRVRMAAEGREGFHFILQDELLEDSRIPPRGFVPDPDTRPVGRDYPVLEGGSLASWDDAPYVVTLPAGLEGVVSVRATLWYQTTSREYVESLRDENVTDDRGQRLHTLWQRYDRSPPVEMATASARIVVAVPPAFDVRGGGCAIAPPPAVPFGLPLAFAAILWCTRRLRRKGEPG